MTNLILRLTVRRRPGKAGIDVIRRKAARVDRWFARTPTRVVVEDDQLAGIPVQRIRPTGGEVKGTLFLIHGGGWCIKTPNLHAGLGARLALGLGMEAVLPDYRLAPEHPFPAAPDDCWEAWQGLLRSGVQASEVVLAGDSAGGGLALGLLGRIRQHGGDMPRCCLLMSPATDLASMGLSAIANEHSEVMFCLPMLLLFRQWYLGMHNPTDPLASPYWGDFTGFPPLMFQVSSAELLLDNTLLAEAKARQQGVTTHLRLWPGMPHDHTLFASLPEARQGLQELMEFARRY